ncbi:hypothetical protein MLD38_022111 [Melastoma candidum]|uniref:Uncharacterized protein n=1 Tax=Melastoma candidum TaxID=119954 RepID=A0ACB9QJD9_9MYRT|nr:hypothetical protein MLD38_022111 [Melastoma candidum]
MSSGGRRGGGGGGGDGARVPTLEEVRRTIQNIRETTGKQHSDEEVYTILEECSMDPNETAQKLLYLDTFHEVKSKRERRREISVRSPESGPGRGVKGNRHPRLNHVSSGGGKIAVSQREKVGNSLEKGQLSATSFPQKGKATTPSHVPRATAPLQNGLYGLSNGSSLQGSMPSSSSGAKVTSGTSAWKEVLTPQASHSETKDDSSRIISNSLTEDFEGITGAAENQTVSATLVSGFGFATATGAQSQLGTDSLEQKAQAKLIISEKPPLIQSAEVQKIQGTHGLKSPSSADHGDFAAKAPLEKESSLARDTSDPVKVVASKVAELTVDASSRFPSSSRIYDGQPVTFPNHFKVPEALKNGLTFGSFDLGLGAKTDISNGITSDDKSSFGVDSSAGSDLTVQEPFPSEVGGISEQHEDLSLLLKKDQKSLENQVLVDNGPIYDPGALNLISDVPQNHVIEEVHASGFGLVPSIMGTQVQPEGLDTQARDTLHPSTFALQNGNASTMSSPSPTPVPPLQSSIVSPQPIPVFRQPSFPLNYFIYGPYISPFYLPTVPQLINPNGFTQQSSAGNLYPSPVITAQGIKYPFPSFKPGSNTAPFGIPSAFGAYGTAALGFTPGQAVVPGNSPSNEEISSQLKENHAHSNAAPTSEVSTIWVPPLLGQDPTSLQVSSLYNLPQGPHVALSPAQAGHVPFGMQNMAAPSNVHPLLQQPQSGAIESPGPTSGAYPHPQHGQMNWNTNF